jgi:hypothetical protein
MADIQPEILADPAIVISLDTTDSSSLTLLTLS